MVYVGDVLRRKMRKFVQFCECLDSCTLGLVFHVDMHPSR